MHINVRRIIVPPMSLPIPITAPVPDTIHASPPELPPTIL